jgi:hypothetical protein
MHSVPVPIDVRCYSNSDIIAMPSRWLKQIARSEELLTIAIFGFSISASEMPSAFHCARRTAQRDVPRSKLLRRFALIFNAAPPETYMLDFIREYGKANGTVAPSRKLRRVRLGGMLSGSSSGAYSLIVASMFARLAR